jgi:transcriptional regulator with XRE-family HTH domain
MTMNFKELQAHMSPGARARAQAKAEQMERELALDELREAMRLTQEALAARLHVNQAAISKVERRADMMISTLRKYIEAMGGQLEIRAIMPDGAVKINRFSEVSDPPPTASNEQEPIGIV